MATRFKNLLLAGMLLALSACATQGAVLTTGVGAIRASATAADAETEKVFGEINAAQRDDVITLLLAQKARPSEEAFAPVITPETAARWNAIFDGVDKYLGGIQDLVDTKRSAAITEDLQGVGEALQSPNFGVKIPNEAVGLFANLGGALVQAAAEKKAQDVMRRTDPEFRALMGGLAELVGGPESRPGTLRAMVDEHWAGLLIGVEHSFGAVLTAPDAARSPLLVSYGKLLDERQAYRDRLERLRRALVAIGEAHSAAAKGSPGGTYYWIGQINGYVKQAREDAKAGDK
ncbi:hypothetical protein HZY97_06400 [Sphingomonas sp. R-74633]|uniref:hypothetical protein n=1 Tax=Sphingomonas sp. R-74633 TaxID=2751188 RepID=UPI0015D130D5|nr:hypothetical protein [Sphingomonas sp. R-74633]NYT40378.1 hypothetical protein [Sphingomonas sp. R-74633]